MNVVEAVLDAGIGDQGELDEYVRSVAFRTMRSQGDREIDAILRRDDVRDGFPALDLDRKKMIFFHTLSLDPWMRRWACSPVHPNRVRPALHADIQAAFFVGLSRLREKNVWFQIEDDDFVSLVRQLYVKLRDEPRVKP